MPEVLELILKGRPMPYKRVRGHNGRFMNPKEYTDYKRRIGAEALKQSWAQNWDQAPPKGTDIYKKVYLKKARYVFSASIRRHKDTGDLSNYIKAIEDAIQDVGIIGDDKLIKHYKNCSFEKIPTKIDECIIVKLERYYV